MPPRDKQYWDQWYARNPSMPPSPFAIWCQENYLEEFKERYQSDDGMAELWKTLQKACDLNVQRNQIIDEVDEKVVEIVKAGLSGESLDDGKFIQRKHKTY